MIKILEGFADNVVAASAVGRVTREDYEAVLIPRVEAAAKRHSKIRCYYEISADFTGMEPGAVWEDFSLDFSNAVGSRWRTRPSSDISVVRTIRLAGYLTRFAARASGDFQLPVMRVHQAARQHSDQQA
ncbi:MAG TPA: STAS/SEC14 domain-containing protein [Steroidobacteraceae bacterium]|nr:STAS/SEC14 domain-containing protein [Steroidobacteraceae bacterium]